MADDAGFALFVANVPQCTPEELTRFFEDAGVRVQSVEIKNKFAFVRVPDADARDRAIADVHNTSFMGREIKVEMARGNGGVKDREAERRKNTSPTDTLFIVNFDGAATTDDDLRAWCSAHGAVSRIEKRGSFAFVQFASVAEATEALRGLDGSELGGKPVTVEFSGKDWNRPPRQRGTGGGRPDGRGRRDDRRRDDRGRGRSPNRSPRRGRSPNRSPRRGGDREGGDERRGGYGRGRSPSPPSYRSGRDRQDPYERRRDDYREERRDDGYSRRDNYRDDRNRYDDRPREDRRRDDY